MPYKKYDYKIIIEEKRKNNLSSAEIIKKYGVSRPTLCRILKDNGIESGYQHNATLLTKEFLEEHYIRKQKAMWYIAKEFGIRSSNTVKCFIKRHGIPIRPGNKKTFKRLREYPWCEWRGCEDIDMAIVSSIKHGAKRRNLEFDEKLITPKYLWNLYIKQNKLCSLSGVKINFAYIRNKKCKAGGTASLDRIDSSKGYIEGNLQWIHKDLQSMKMDKSQESFLEWCGKIAKYNNLT